MSRHISSHDPQKQDILGLIYGYANQDLIKALQDWNKEKKQDDFFLAACNNRGRGLVNILIKSGFSCTVAPLDLAIDRGCWKLAEAMVPALGSLSPVIMMYQVSALPHPLLKALSNGQDRLARVLFEVIPYKDRVQTANTCLHALANDKKAVPEASQSVKWLVEEGADPNEEIARGCQPLSVVLNAGRLDFAHALMDAGATLSKLGKNASSELAVGLYRGRDWDMSEYGTPLNGHIPQSGWALVDRAMKEGVCLPKVVDQAFDGFDRSSGKLTKHDAQKAAQLREAFWLQQTTTKIERVRPSPRL